MAAGTVTADGRARVLADGNEIPLLGLGVWQVPDGRECEDAVRWALEAGYRHVDTAQAYGNERSVGRALRDSGLPREEVFITTKFNPGRRDPEAEVQRSLERLGVDAVDLYIIHWPQGGPTWAWEGMQRAHGRGCARSIGVSNFGASDLRAVLEVADVPPVINQVQFSPFAFRRALLETCDRRGVALEAYSPLGTGLHLGDRRVAAMAERLGRTPAQILIRWSLQRDLVVLPKSTHRERIEQNAQVFDFQLSDEDMGALDGLDRTGGTDRGQDQRPGAHRPVAPRSSSLRHRSDRARYSAEPGVNQRVPPSHGSISMEQQAREQAFISALTTEQFVLQAARSANVGEMTGRATIYMGAVSSALIAFGFLAQVTTRLDPFVAAVLPAVFLLGEFTFAALLRNTLENLVLWRQMQRIRSYYRTLVPEADQFFGQAAEDERISAAMATVGLRARPAGMLFTGASVIAAINSVVGGVGLALLAARVASLATGAALAVGITAAVVLFGLHLLYQQQRATSLVLQPPARPSSV